MLSVDSYPYIRTSHFLAIQSEHNASTVRKVRSACVPFVSSVRPQCTEIRMRAGRPLGSFHAFSLLPSSSSLSSMLLSPRSTPQSRYALLKSLPRFHGPMSSNPCFGNQQKPRTLLCPPISCPRARKQKEKCDDAEEATASKIVHRNVVIIRDSKVETLSITQKPYLKSIISRTLENEY